jgi:hypothetical protein
MIEEYAQALAEAQVRGQQISEWVLLANLEFFDDLPEVMKERRKKLEESLYPGANLTDQMRKMYVAVYTQQHGGVWPYGAQSGRVRNLAINSMPPGR